MSEDLVTKSMALPSKISKDRVEHDFSLDYVAYMSLSGKFVRREATEEGLKYYLKNGSTIEMRDEITSIGKVVVYFNNCPKEIYDSLQNIEKNIIKLANRCG